MTVLSLEFEVTGFDRMIYSEAAHWDNVDFEMCDELVARIRISEDGIFSPKQREERVSNMYQRVKSLILGLEFQYGVGLIYKQISTPHVDDENGAMTLVSRIAVNDHMEFEIMPAAPPDVMPSMPDTAERFIRTLVEARKFNDYVEEQLRRHYLIIEELWPQYGKFFPKCAHQAKKEIKNVRDFVSHAVCNHKEVVSFIKKNLPSSVVSGPTSKVSFNRSVEHRNFIARYEVLSRDLAKNLIKMV